jgi:uncharacterized protein (TIGR02246 family)
MHESSQLENNSSAYRAAGRVGGVRAASCLTGAWRIAILAIVAMLCGAGLVHGQNQKNKKSKDQGNDVTGGSVLPENAGIDLLVTQMLGAWQAGDADAMRKFYADDVVVISGGWEPPLIGYENYARAYQAQLARSAGSRLERTNSYIKVMGDTAWVTYQWQYVGIVDGRAAQAYGHTTLVLQKRAGAWLIVLNHTSAIPTDQPPAETSSAPKASDATSSLAPAGK